MAWHQYAVIDSSRCTEEFKNLPFLVILSRFGANINHPLRLHRIVWHLFRDKQWNLMRPRLPIDCCPSACVKHIQVMCDLPERSWKIVGPFLSPSAKLAHWLQHWFFKKRKSSLGQQVVQMAAFQANAKQLWSKLSHLQTLNTYSRVFELNITPSQLLLN